MKARRAHILETSLVYEIRTPPDSFLFRLKTRPNAGSVLENLTNFNSSENLQKDGLARKIRTKNLKCSHSQNYQEYSMRHIILKL